MLEAISLYKVADNDGSPKSQIEGAEISTIERCGNGYIMSLFVSFLCSFDKTEI